MPLIPFDLPPGFVAHAARDERWARWVDSVPRTVAEVLDEWELVVDGAPRHGHTALVVPVRADTGRAVLKVGWPHDGCQHEALALQTWHGRGAVRLVRADPRRAVMLLERLGDRDLTTVDALEACEVVAGLYARLHVPAPPRLPTLSSYVRGWADELEQLDRGAPVPRRMIEHAVHLARSFAEDAGTDGRLVHTDLRDENVLAGDREPWLAIDPKPVSGDPHYEVAPLLWNRWDEVVASGDVRAAVRRRFHTVVDTAGLDESRARDWVVVREALNAMWAVQDGEPGRVTTAVAVTKAVQD